MVQDGQVVLIRYPQTDTIPGKLLSLWVGGIRA